MGDLSLKAEDLAEIREFTVVDIEREIASAAEGPEREALKAAIREAEVRSADDGDAPRQGVLDATEPIVAPAPPSGTTAASTPDDETPEATDDSGRPPLAEVAEERASGALEMTIDDGATAQNAE